MPGWRVGFCCGNPELIAALTRIKSYLDYGIFTPVQVAAIAALEEISSAFVIFATCTGAGAMCCAMASTRRVGRLSGLKPPCSYGPKFRRRSATWDQ